MKPGIPLTHVLLAVAATAVLYFGVVLFVVPAASAGTPAAWDNACPAAEASCERLSFIAAELQRQGVLQRGYYDPLVTGSGTAYVAPSTATQAVSGTVALSDSDRERLDLAWWGSWALVGLVFVLILAPRWFAAFRVTHGS